MKVDRSLVSENMEMLSQAVRLLEDLSDPMFTNNEEAWFQSGVGRHMRHIISFYIIFLQGLPEGIIDYDRRPRHPELETSRSAAVARLRDIMTALERVDDLHRKVMSKTDGHLRNPEAAFSPSTVGRELQFLAFHTVHHFAMVAMTLDRQGFKTPAGFGVAPSTLAYLRATGSGPISAGGSPQA